jgi:hypothetical protein
MKKLSLQQRIVDYLKQQYPLFVHKGEIERLAMSWGYLGDNAGRRCRELERKGIIRKMLNKNKEVMYQFVLREQTPQNVIMNQIIDQQKLASKPLLKQENLKI